MKNYLFILFFIANSVSVIFAQKNDKPYGCAIPDLTRSQMKELPWYGNNQFLYDFLDSLEQGGSNLRIERDFEGYQVAVQAWVYNDDDGRGITPKTWHIMRWLNIVNDLYKRNGVPIKLYLLCEPTQVNNSNYYRWIDSYENYLTMVSERYNPNALNVHFVWNNITSPRWGGLATTPSQDFPYTVATIMDMEIIDNDENIGDLLKQRQHAAILAHEIGHALGLVHTHHGGRFENRNYSYSANAQANECEQEYVDRGKILNATCPQIPPSALAAEQNGDMLIDTPADPKLNLDGMWWVEYDCNYSPNRNGESISKPKDKDGIRWQPSTINFMSYTRLHCMFKDNSMTRLQKAVMLWYLERHWLGMDIVSLNPFIINYPPNPIVHNKAEIDEYENDNHFEVANFVNLSRLTRQHHTLHQNLGELSITEGICDEDWLTFDVAYARKVIVATRSVEGKPNADTYLELFRQQTNASGNTILVPVAQDNDGSPYGMGYSRIIENNLSAGKYYVRVTSRSSSLGHYVIGIFPERENWGSGGSGGGGIGNGNGDGEVGIDIGTPDGSGGDIDGNGTVDYLCDDAQISVTGLDLSPPNYWTIEYSVNNSIATISSTGLLRSNGYFGNIVITAMIKYDGVLVANAVQSVWIGKPERPVLEVGNMTGVDNIICQGEDIYLSSVNSTRGFANSYKWELYKNGIKVYEGITPSNEIIIDRLVNVPVGTYTAYVFACNDCGCNRSLAVTLRVIPIRQCANLGKIQVSNLQKEISIYPNPVNNKLTIKLPTLYNENPTQVELYNSIGQLVLSKNYTETNIEFSVSSFPKGLYFLKIQNGNEMKTEKIVIE